MASLPPPRQQQKRWFWIIRAHRKKNEAQEKHTMKQTSRGKIPYSAVQQQQNRTNVNCQAPGSNAWL